MLDHFDQGVIKELFVNSGIEFNWAGEELTSEEASDSLGGLPVLVAVALDDVKEANIALDELGFAISKAEPGDSLTGYQVVFNKANFGFLRLMFLSHVIRDLSLKLSMEKTNKVDLNALFDRYKANIENTVKPVRSGAS